MRLATIRTSEGTRAVRLDGEHHIDLGFADLGQLFAQPGWQQLAAAPTAATATSYPVATADFAPVVLAPSKVICTGLNYTNHIMEGAGVLPDYPVLFPKFAETLLGANDDIVRPPETEQLDWEVELAVVIGATVRRADEAQASAAIAGFSVLNDVSVRDWQSRTREWSQGKIWEATTPVGPYVVTPDEVGGVRPALRVSTTVDGQIMQDDNTGDLLFDPVHLVRYISTVLSLKPGDIIATGTPAGVGTARRPKLFLQPGQVMSTSIEHLGTCTNRVLGA